MKNLNKTLDVRTNLYKEIIPVWKVQKTHRSDVFVIIDRKSD